MSNVEKPEGRRPLERLRRGWADNKEIDGEDVYWINMVQDRDWWRDLVNTFRVRIL
jgi:hypothetical protein